MLNPKQIAKKILNHYRIPATYPLLDLFYSQRFKYVNCGISKNGTSSILASIMTYDFGESFDHDVKLWCQPEVYLELSPQYRMTDDNFTPEELSRLDGFRKFIVLRDPMDRFISFINNTYKEEEYRRLFNNNVSPEKYVDSVLRKFPKMIDYQRKDRRYDKHAVPQRVYYEKFHALFGDELEVVRLEDLPNYFESITGQPFVKNNVTLKSQKVCTLDTLTPKQLATIQRYLQKYEFHTQDEYTKFFNK